MDNNNNFEEAKASITIVWKRMKPEYVLENLNKILVFIRSSVDSMCFVNMNEQYLPFYYMILLDDTFLQTTFFTDECKVVANEILRTLEANIRNFTWEVSFGTPFAGIPVLFKKVYLRPSHWGDENPIQRAFKQTWLKTTLMFIKSQCVIMKYPEMTRKEAQYLYNEILKLNDGELEPNSMWSPVWEALNLFKLRYNYIVSLHSTDFDYLKFVLFEKVSIKRKRNTPEVNQSTTPLVANTTDSRGGCDINNSNNNTVHENNEVNVPVINHHELIKTLMENKNRTSNTTVPDSEVPCINQPQQDVNVLFEEVNDNITNANQTTEPNENIIASEHQTVMLPEKLTNSPDDTMTNKDINISDGDNTEKTITDGSINERMDVTHDIAGVNDSACSTENPFLNQLTNVQNNNCSQYVKQDDIMASTDNNAAGIAGSTNNNVREDVSQFVNPNDELNDTDSRATSIDNVKPTRHYHTERTQIRRASKIRRKRKFVDLLSKKFLLTSFRTLLDFVHDDSRATMEMTGRNDLEFNFLKMFNTFLPNSIPVESVFPERCVDLVFQLFNDCNNKNCALEVDWDKPDEKLERKQISSYPVPKRTIGETKKWIVTFKKVPLKNNYLQVPLTLDMDTTGDNPVEEVRNPKSILEKPLGTRPTAKPYRSRSVSPVRETTMTSQQLNNVSDTDIPSRPAATDDRNLTASMETKLMDRLSVPLESDKALRMMRLMGWKGGALGVRAGGLIEPLQPKMNVPRGVGLGHEIFKMTNGDSNDEDEKKEHCERIDRSVQTCHSIDIDVDTEYFIVDDENETNEDAYNKPINLQGDEKIGFSNLELVEVNDDNNLVDDNPSGSADEINSTPNDEVKDITEKSMMDTASKVLSIRSCETNVATQEINSKLVPNSTTNKVSDDENKSTTKSAMDTQNQELENKPSCSVVTNEGDKPIEKVKIPAANTQWYVCFNKNARNVKRIDKKTKVIKHIDSKITDYRYRQIIEEKFKAITANMQNTAQNDLDSLIERNVKPAVEMDSCVCDNVVKTSPLTNVSFKPKRSNALGPVDSASLSVGHDSVTKSNINADVNEKENIELTTTCLNVTSTTQATIDEMKFFYTCENNSKFLSTRIQFIINLLKLLQMEKNYITLPIEKKNYRQCMTYIDSTINLLNLRGVITPTQPRETAIVQACAREMNAHTFLNVSCQFKNNILYLMKHDGSDDCVLPWTLRAEVAAPVLKATHYTSVLYCQVPKDSVGLKRDMILVNRLVLQFVHSPDESRVYFMGRMPIEIRVYVHSLLSLLNRQITQYQLGLGNTEHPIFRMMLEAMEKFCLIARFDRRDTFFHKLQLVKVYIRRRCHLCLTPSAAATRHNVQNVGQPTPGNNPQG